MPLNPIPNWPGSLDSLPDPTSATYEDDDGFEIDLLLQKHNAILEALEAAFGIDEASAQHTPLANTLLASSTNGKFKWRQGAAADMANGAFMVKLGDTVLGSDASSIFFSGISGAWRGLKLSIYARLAAAITSGILYVRINGDSGANYDYQINQGSNATASAAQTFGDAAIKVGDVPGASAGANLFAAIDVEIPHYAGTSNNKALVARCALKTGTSAGNMTVQTIAGFWRSNAAITSLQLISGAGGNLLAGSAATLYGLPL